MNSPVKIKANNPAPKGYEKAFEKGRDGDGVVITENQELFSWLEGLSIPVVFAKKNLTSAQAYKLSQNWRLVFTPFDSRQYRIDIAKAVDSIAATELIVDIEEPTLEGFMKGSSNANKFEDYLSQARWYEYREELERKKHMACPGLG